MMAVGWKIRTCLGRFRLWFSSIQAARIANRSCPYYNAFMRHIRNIPWYASAGRKVLHRYPAIGKSKGLRCHIPPNKTGRFISCLPAIPFLASMWWMKKESFELSLRTIHWPVMRIWCRLWRDNWHHLNKNNRVILNIEKNLQISRIQIFRTESSTTRLHYVQNDTMED